MRRGRRGTYNNEARFVYLVSGARNSASSMIERTVGKVAVCSVARTTSSNGFFCCIAASATPVSAISRLGSGLLVVVVGSELVSVVEVLGVMSFECRR